jgi:hypothetical protein
VREFPTRKAAERYKAEHDDWRGAPLALVTLPADIDL